MAWAQPNPMAFVLVLVLGGNIFLRWQTWRAESVILTRARLIRVRGVPETTSSESSLRLDRISGVVLEQTVLGKILDYGSIEVEAPGQHPDVRILTKIGRPHPFYLQIRRVVFGEGVDLDPDDRPQDFVTAPLPRLPDVRRPR
jgi:Bacterial PH domain